MYSFRGSARGLDPGIGAPFSYSPSHKASLSKSRFCRVNYVAIYAVKGKKLARDFGLFGVQAWQWVVKT